jgi:hypothetical protein
MAYYEKIMEKAASLGKVEIIGKTGLGREIPLVRIGNDPKVLLVAGIHGREHITTDLLFELLATEADGLSVDCIPSLNIDGACLCKEGTDSVGNVFLRPHFAVLQRRENRLFAMESKRVRRRYKREFRRRTGVKAGATCFRPRRRIT